MGAAFHYVWDLTAGQCTAVTQIIIGGSAPDRPYGTWGTSTLNGKEHLAKMGPMVSE